MLLFEQSKCVKGVRQSIEDACKALEWYTDIRQCAEYGTFKNWYRGDVKMGVKPILADTKRIMGYGG